MLRAKHLSLLVLTLLFVAPTLRAADKTKKVMAKDITLNVPTTWKQSPASNNLRTAQFAIPKVEGDRDDAELVVYFFGGAGGGVNANLERWSGQFQPGGKKQKIYKGESKQGEYYLLDITGVYNKPIGPPINRQTNPTPGYQMLAVVLMVKDKGNYFLKLTGPQKTVAAASKALRLAIDADLKKEAELKPEGEK
ncbi:MAG: hypothetical protein CMM06_13665 [Rhodopirellula sp.]|nr:hypothetical protein [Rhodopirellula sp.]|tara:strand:+ start:4139 stop:4720 length:582 start_codon:yes stop_codon:yes gene_type:complete